MISTCKHSNLLQLPSVAAEWARRRLRHNFASFSLFLRTQMGGALGPISALSNLLSSCRNLPSDGVDIWSSFIWKLSLERRAAKRATFRSKEFMCLDKFEITFQEFYSQRRKLKKAAAMLACSRAFFHVWVFIMEYSYIVEGGGMETLDIKTLY